MRSEQITLYANEDEKKQHGHAISLLCEELAKKEEIIRPLYEQILLDMKKNARIQDYLSILVYRSVRDLAKHYTNPSMSSKDNNVH